MLGTILSLADGLRWGCPKQPGLVFQTKKSCVFFKGRYQWPSYILSFEENRGDLFVFFYIFSMFSS